MIKKKLVAIFVAVAMILQGSATLILPSYASAANGNTKTAKAGVATVAVTAPEKVANDFQMSAAAVKKETTDKIASKVKENLKDKKTVEKTIAYDISVKDGGGHPVKLEDKKSVFTVSIKRMDIKGAKKENVVVYHVGEGASSVAKINSTVESDGVKFTTKHFSTFAVVVFGDVPVKKADSKQATSKKADPKKTAPKTDVKKDSLKEEKSTSMLKEGAAEEFKVTFDSKGGSKVEDQPVKKDEKAEKPTNPTRKGYVFKYWANTDTNAEYNFEDPVTKDLHLYAVWEEPTPQQFTVTFITNGGSPTPSKQTVDEGSKPTKPKSPARKGYRFAGWYDSDTDTVYNFSTGVTKNIKLYAKWNRNSYKIYFKSNKGTGSMSPQSMKYDISKNLKANRFKKTGHRFIGWTTNSNGSGKRYVNKQNVINLTAKQNGKVTLYAQWQKKNYRITYNLNGGSFGKKKDNITQVYTYGQTIKVIGAPTRAGYQFLYWQGSSQYKPGSNYVVKGKETLTAQWKKGNGNGQVRNSLNNQNGKTGQNRTQNGKKTGDDRMLIGLILIAAASGTAAVVLYRRRKKS